MRAHDLVQALNLRRRKYNVRLAAGFFRPSYRSSRNRVVARAPGVSIVAKYIPGRAG